MTRARIMLLRLTLATAAGIGGLFVSDRALTPNSGSLVSQASAVIGRPLTPLSYAGVARRTTRRAVYGAAAVGAVAPRCVQVADAYGRIVTRCY
jgi:hypothetical protein